MRQKVVVVEHLSQFKLEPFDDTVSYFALFGYPISLRLDLSDLQSRFYALSKLVHPDKFTLKTPKEQMLAMRWSTLINRAYQTLKDRDKRANYVLTLFGKSRTQNAKVPLELAESYFELQDLLVESQSKEPLIAFQKQLLEQKENAQEVWQRLEQDWEKSPDKTPLLNRIAEQLNFEHYLSSMLEDLEKKL